MAGRETEEDFLRMQQEAINRVREMQARARRTLENNGMHIENQRYQNMREEKERQTNDNFYPMTEENNYNNNSNERNSVSQTTHYIPHVPHLGNVNVPTMGYTNPSEISRQNPPEVGKTNPHEMWESNNKIDSMQSERVAFNSNSINQKSDYTQRANHYSNRTAQNINESESDDPPNSRRNPSMNNYFNNHNADTQSENNNHNSNKTYNPNMNYPPNHYSQQNSRNEQENESTIKNAEKPLPHEEEKKQVLPKSDGGLGDLLNIPLSGLNINIDKDQLILLGTLYALFKDGGDNWLMMAVAYILFT